MLFTTVEKWREKGRVTRLSFWLYMQWNEADSLVPRRYPAQSLMAPSSLVLPMKSRENDAIAHMESHDGGKYDKKSMA